MEFIGIIGFSQIIYLQTRKLNFIQELLSVSNKEIIDKLETLLKREGQHPTAFDLLGVLNKEEVEEMERTIASS